MAVSFAEQISILFTDTDVDCMSGSVELHDFGFMSDPAGNDEFPDHWHARKVLKRLSLPVGLQRMPRGFPPWPPEQIALFGQWIEDGCLP